MGLGGYRLASVGEAGSNPALVHLFRYLAQLGGAPALGAGGRELESLNADHLYAEIVQLVEQLSCK